MSSQPPKSGVDWQQVKQWLAAAEQRYADDDEMTPEQAKVVMDQRAHRLARVPEQAPDSSEMLEVVAFDVAGDQLAIETRFVYQVLCGADITPLPGAPDFVVGLINLRGEVLAVMDFRRLLDISTESTSHQPQILVLGQDRLELGILADQIRQVTSLRASDIREPPEGTGGSVRPLLRGVTQEALLVLDGHQLIKDENLYIDETD